LTGFARNSDGGVTIFAVIAFSMLLVMIGLVFDVGRVMNVHSEAGSYADRAALAAAAELDGRPCAVVRAVAAVTGDDGNGCNYDRIVPRGRRLTLSGDSFVSVQRMTFYSSWPLDPSPTVTARWTRGDTVRFTASQGTANRTSRYVMVETTQETEQFLFFSMFGSATSSATVAPRAIAGFERRVCNSTPLMICNPDESSPFNAQAGRDINNLRLHYTGGWGRGQFALLDVANRSPNALENYMESSNPDTQCYARRVSVEQAFNNQQSQAILEGLDDRDDDNDVIPVAIVNCNQNSGLLSGSQAIPRVPIETWARVEVTDVSHEEECVEWDRDRRGNRRCTRTVDHYEMDLEVRGTMPADENVTREYPVLVR
jgi:Flp pilus assembly protein TadG